MKESTTWKNGQGTRHAKVNMVVYQGRIIVGSYPNLRKEQHKSPDQLVSLLTNRILREGQVKKPWTHATFYHNIPTARGKSQPVLKIIKSGEV